MGKIITPEDPRLVWGVVIAKDSPIRRKKVGVAKADDGTSYEISVSEPSEFPIVRSLTTGRFWTIQWEKLIELAIEEGLD